jgi:hypothetical protein
VHLEESYFRVNSYTSTVETCRKRCVATAGPGLKSYDKGMNVRRGVALFTPISTSRCSFSSTVG